MKKQYWIYIVLFLVGLGVGLYFGLRSSVNRQPSTVCGPMEVRHIVFADSVSMFDATAYQRMEVDFPQASDTSAVARAVRAWLYEDIPFLAGIIDDPEEVALRLDLPSTIDDSAYVEAYARYGLDTQRSLLEVEAGEGWTVNVEHDCSVTKAYDEESYVTYLVNRYSYEGGAHGGTIVYGVTFDKPTGERMGWNLVADRDTVALARQIKEGLKAYLSEGSDEVISSDEDLLEHLLVWCEDSVDAATWLPQLPATAPWQTPEGIVFLYQQYEIAPYAAGHPTVVL